MAVLVVVSCFSLILFLLGFSRFRFAFESAAGAQDSTFFGLCFGFAGCVRRYAATADAEGVTAPLDRVNTPLMVRGFGGRGQTGGRAVLEGRTAKDTLLFGRLGLARVRRETWVSCEWCAELRLAHFEEAGQFLAP